MCTGTIQAALRLTWPDATYFRNGGNSYVYKATEKGSTIALKAFRRFGNPERFPRFLREIRIMEKIRGMQGVVPIIAYNENEKPPLNCNSIKTTVDVAWFSMPFYDSNLFDQLAAIAVDDGSTAMSIALRLATIIKVLHDLNYAHRDLKPENILFDGKEFFISDYGLSIDLDSDLDPEHRVSGQLELIGSVTYRAPELLRGRLDKSDHRPCDIFSLGRILWAMVFGKSPDGITDFEFSKISVKESGRQIRKPALFEEIIRAATATDPTHRIKIDQFIEGLNLWLMENKKDSHEKLIDNLINNPETMEIAKFRATTKAIQEAHTNTMNFLQDEFFPLLSKWKDIADKYKANTGSIGNDFAFMSPKYYPSFDPENLKYERFQGEPSGFIIRFNLGNINTSPLIQIGVYIDFHPDHWEGQRYLVFGGIITKGSKDQVATLVTNPKATAFDYRGADVKQKILKELTDAYEVLDSMLREG